MEATSVHADAHRKAVKGHRTWLVFKRRDGEFEARLYSASAIKSAMLAGGTKGRFTWYDPSGASNICRSWNYALHLLKCARGAERYEA